MPSYDEILAGAEAARRRIQALDKTRLTVSIDTSSIAVGALETLQAIRDEVTRRGYDVDVDQVGGNGLSFANPTVEIAGPSGLDVLYQKVTARDVPAFLDAVIGRNELDNDWLLGLLDGEDGHTMVHMEDHPWWQIQERRLTADMSVCDPDNIDHFIARGAYAGLEKALGMTQEEVIAEQTGAKLLGRSGSFFPTGRKWDFLRTSPTNPKAMVCNADEGDPGAWVNRMTMESDPHALIEGMTIGGYACGAQEGWIYIREEYPLAVERVQHAVDQAREKGLLGTNILGRDFSFDLKVVRGAGSYVCGEETGLIASTEDSRGMPKVKPPFPAASGVYGLGSNVNNVGSYHSAAWIMRNGVEKWAEVGTERNPGTMLFTLSGHVQNVGCFELPFGTTVRDAYELCGGGPEPGHRFKALQPGGPLLGVVGDFILDATLEPESFREKGAVGLGGGGLVFLDERACILDLCAQYEWFIEDESCGRCTTCHGGTQRALELIKRIQRGGGRESDIAKMRLLGDTLRYSNCFHGQFAMSIVSNALQFFIDEVNEHIFNRHCRAGVCQGLTTYNVDREALTRPEYAEALARANDLCLTKAMGQSSEACLNCVVCHDVLPDVVRRVDAFPLGTGPAPELVSVQPPH